MQIWVDADACPAAIKDILYRAAERLKVSLVLVANKLLKTPASPFIRTIQVPAGFNVADNHIALQVEPDDLVITADIPLAAAVVEKGGYALDPRGELYTRENIGQRLTLRDFMDGLRGAGVDTGGPPPLHKNDRKAFADELDRFLSKRLKSCATASTHLT
ncbi:YaiI/YqxD family protein [Desulforhabdus sp. TSK]|uniref:YaiI/YqxD family protein n=1 Tax=Desulforhabdus sp. TSK TaxID=2925014 RepID=UPI001FC8B71C|nr:YaiI/YqxD family protein [Desulforhabdus sp. TSK]GKT08058.1 UPF0178 protein [Desulforhabdus sp. TSK]